MVKAAVTAENKLLLSEECPAAVEAIFTADIRRVGEITRAVWPLIIIRVGITGLKEELTLLITVGGAEDLTANTLEEWAQLKSRGL